MSGVGGLLGRALAALTAILFFRRARRRAERRQAEAEAQAPPPEPVPPDELDASPDPGAELAVALLLFAAALAAAGFVFFYAFDADTQALGICLGVALLLAGVAAALAGKRVVIQEKTTEPYSEFGDEEETREVEDYLVEGKVGVTRRRLLFTALGAVGAALGAAAVVPIASLGPRVGNRVYSTPWSPGTKLVDEDGVPLTLRDLGEGEFLTGFPEGAPLDDLASPLIVVRLNPEELELPDDRAHSAPHGVVAYSKICTHAGCAVSMLRYPTFPAQQPRPGLVCPCHYSTFNPCDGGSVEFGPAGRPLPQLPLRIAADGVTLEAAGDFYEPVGPSYGGIREDPRGQS
ncbi:MAG TPA: ubiquinol-cytochrome c reductase iron-sulfur subunit [Solirubrobacterales bacterium]|nr:ubiquinol-cytochrome c reductase iron-sulfur subunit [Solirubrobacterales bacterium]